MKEKIKLSGVPETMLQTVYARAKESRGRGTIHDAKAEEIIEKLDYDFSLADKDTAMHSGVIARTIVLDKLTKSWLSTHSGAVVVNIACGLDTRCYRMSGYSHWYNLDLPETVAVREKLLPESGTISQIAMSAMDDWGGEISEQTVPVLIVIEGLTMYLNTKDVQQIFAVISSRFEKATVFVETMNPMIVKRFTIIGFIVSTNTVAFSKRLEITAKICCTSFVFRYMVSPSMTISTGTVCSLISPPQSSMADIAICEIVPLSGRSFSRTATVSGRSRLYQCE